jgi:hypothetical protein
VSRGQPTARIAVSGRGQASVVRLAYEAVRLLTDLGRRTIGLDDGMLEWRLRSCPSTPQT